MDFVLSFLPGVLDFVLSNWPHLGPFVLGAGVLCMILSIATSAVNLGIAQAVDASWNVPGWVLKVAAVCNLLSGNLDKAGRFLRGYRGPALPAPKNLGK